jgi:hypothetical protein
MKTLEPKIELTRIDGTNRKSIEYTVAKFIEAYSVKDNSDSQQEARGLSSRLLAKVS